MKDQQRNRTNNALVEYNGERHCVTEWAEILGIKAGTLFDRLYRQVPVDRAFKKTLVGIVIFIFALFLAERTFAASATLTWQHNEAGGGAEEGFTIERSDNGGTFKAIGAVKADVLTYVDNTITAPPPVTAPAPPGKNSFCFRVVSFNHALPVPPATTGALQPAAPSNVGCVDYLGMVNPAPIAPPAAASGLTATLDTSARKAPAAAQRKK